MRKQFTKNDTQRLPWKTEAYRLWFEFFKAAKTDRGISVKKTAYADWGNVGLLQFDDWWNTKCQKLFAVESGAEEITSDRQWATHSSNVNRLTLSVPLDCNVRDTLEDIRAILAQKAAGTRARIQRGASGALYSISAKNLKYPHLRQLLRIYQYWLDSGKDLDQTAKRYHAWASLTNAKRKKWEAQRKAKGKKPYWVIVPEAGWDAYLKGDAGDQRRAMRRYIKKAVKIAENVADGRFPGNY